MAPSTRSCLLAFLLAWPAAAAAGFSAGDAVQVREGDVWSPAEYLGAEGRRHEIRYADGTTEWVTADRVREAGDVDPAPDAATAADPEAAERAAERDAEREQRRRLLELRRSTRVEFKDFTQWKEASVKQSSGPLFLVATHDTFGESEFHWEWVGAERLRLPGEDREGPGPSDQFGEKVGIQGVRAALAEAMKAYPAHAEERAAAEQAARRGGADPFSAPPLGEPVAEADRGAMQLRPLAGADPGGESGGDPAARIDPRPDPTARAGGRGVRLEASGGGFFEKVRGLDLHGDTGLVVLEDKPPNRTARVRAERVDLRGGRSSGLLRFDAATLPLAVSADGSRVLAVSNGFHGGARNRLDLWDWPRTGEEPGHVVSFEPFADGPVGETDVADAVFAGGVAVLTGADGAVSGWDAADARALWGWSGAEPDAGATPSPGGRLVAVRAAGGVALLDAASGECVFALPGGSEGDNPLAFSADGRYLAAVDRAVLTLWDLEAGEVLPTVALAPGAEGPAVPLGGGRIRVGDRVLEPATGHHGRVGPLAAGAAASASDAGRLYALVKESGRGGEDARYTLERPDPAAGVAGLRLQTALLLQEGDRVSLDLSGLAVPGGQREALAASLGEQLAARGVEVAEGQPVRLVAASASDTKTLTYETLGGFPGQRERTDVQVTQTTLRFAVEADGVPAWERTRVFGSHAGGMVIPKEGQSIQEALNEQNAVGDASLGSIRLPDWIPDPRAGAAG